MVSSKASIPARVEVRLLSSQEAPLHLAKLKEKPRLKRGFPDVKKVKNQQVKNPPITQKMQETWVRSLDQEDPLEVGLATHSSILAWRIPWTEETGGLQSIKLQSQT